MPIDTRAELHEHIREAIGIELTVFPPYLYAMYSLEDRASEHAKVLMSVAAEEMLHAMLWANLLLATGGDITFCSPTTTAMIISLSVFAKRDMTRSTSPLKRSRYCRVSRPLPLLSTLCSAWATTKATSKI